MFNAALRLLYSRIEFPPLPPHPLSQKTLDKLRRELRMLTKIGYAFSISMTKKVERINAIEALTERYK